MKVDPESISLIGWPMSDQILLPQLIECCIGAHRDIVLISQFSSPNIFCVRDPHHPVHKHPLLLIYPRKGNKGRAEVSPRDTNRSDAGRNAGDGKTPAAIFSGT